MIDRMKKLSYRLKLATPVVIHCGEVYKDNAVNVQTISSLTLVGFLCFNIILFLFPI